MTKCFVDTNVLAYAKDSRFPTKQATAISWIDALVARNAIILSAQSLREYYAVTTRFNRTAGAIQQARHEVALYAAFVPDFLRDDLLDEAWRIQDRYRLNFWDGLLIASALKGKCSIFLSEDMNSGQQIETLAIVNPFTTKPEAVL